MDRRSFLVTAATGLPASVAGCTSSDLPTVTANSTYDPEYDVHLLVRWNAEVFDEPVSYERGDYQIVPRSEQVRVYVTYELENVGETPALSLPRFFLFADEERHTLRPFGPGEAGTLVERDKFYVGKTVVGERIGSVPEDTERLTFSTNKFDSDIGGVVEFEREAGREIPWEPR